MDMSVNLAGIKLKNPLILAAGPLTTTSKGILRAAKAGFGGVVAKSVGLRKKEGHPFPRIIKPTDFYMINAEGLPNPGYKIFSKEVKKAKKSDICIIASVFGTTAEICEVSTAMEKAGADMIELNLSCPHPTDKEVGFTQGDDPKIVGEIVREVKKVVEIPVCPKLPSSRLLDVPLVAKVAEKKGADAVTLVNTFPALAIDIKTHKPMLGNPNGVGGMSGPAVKPVVVKVIAETARMVNIPIMGTGGCSCGNDVIEMMLAGATAVQVTTVILTKGFGIVPRMLEEIKGYLRKSRTHAVSELIGGSLKYLPTKPLYVR
jgi:dihydroorotate dehydrogenase (NAD+) catalytic subunit